MIAIVDYGLGNIQAFANIYNRLDIAVKFAKSADDLEGATHIILPGVGAFDWAMECLVASGMRAALDRLVIEERKPVLGICVGMQIMATRSEEGQADGLAWFDAVVKRFEEPALQKLYLPHMGWNDVDPLDTRDLFRGMSTGSRFYFLHSYYFSPNIEGEALAKSDYGRRFACAVRRQNIFGVQFHPEKSHNWGVLLLKNFAEL